MRNRIQSMEEKQIHIETSQETILQTQHQILSHLDVIERALRSQTHSTPYRYMQPHFSRRNSSGWRQPWFNDDYDSTHAHHHPTNHTSFTSPHPPTSFTSPHPPTSFTSPHPPTSFTSPHPPNNQNSFTSPHLPTNQNSSNPNYSAQPGLTRAISY